MKKYYLFTLSIVMSIVSLLIGVQTIHFDVNINKVCYFYSKHFGYNLLYIVNNFL